MIVAIPDRTNSLPSATRLLGACARPDLAEWAIREINYNLSGVTDWDDFVRQAETNGLGPLSYTHLIALDAPIPPRPHATLRALYLRHKRASTVRVSTLERVLTAMDSLGIRPLVLKGAALAHLVYAEPGLRPMNDIDLFVERTDLVKALGALTELGFTTAGFDIATLPDKHIVATYSVDGLTVRLELHYALFSTSSRRPKASPIVPDQTLEFTLDGRPAYTFPLEALLGHLCQHLVGHADVFTPIRLIWVADIVGLADRFVDRIDWELVRREHPIVPRVLSLLHAVTPLSIDVLRAATLGQNCDQNDAWGDFTGWPRASLAAYRAQGKGYPRILRDTFFPPPWWLRLHHGLSSSESLWWSRWVGHPFEILDWSAQVLRKPRAQQWGNQR